MPSPPGSRPLGGSFAPSARTSARRSTWCRGARRNRAAGRHPLSTPNTCGARPRHGGASLAPIVTVVVACHLSWLEGDDMSGWQVLIIYLSRRPRLKKNLPSQTLLHPSRQNQRDLVQIDLVVRPALALRRDGNEAVRVAVGRVRDGVLRPRAAQPQRRALVQARAHRADRRQDPARGRTRRLRPEGHGVARRLVREREPLVKVELPVCREGD
ncbi:hypothetical protein B0T22DRAFT_33954 [Podospora appendiculata]|uniref:Uncharacterized protein n=1 Tax=Podospora appendiculata TaxID=314037 RepID=A0AAE0XGM3_9PEZI|nr:hypothetical protein B0T22DRAFT_33954 [Podospora appendiculata]